MHHYRFSGLSVVSEMELAGGHAVACMDSPDVAVRFGDVPQQLPDPTESGPGWEREGETILLRVPNVARFLIQRGSAITVALEKRASVGDASGFILGSSLGMLLHQRGALVLHGSAVASNGRAIILCGRSGAGKSTAAAALCRNGCSFVADDICAVRLDADGTPRVLPDGRQLKLWQPSIDRLELDSRRGGAVRETFEKYFVAPENIVSEPPILDAIYQLRESRPGFRDGIEALGPPDAMRMLQREAYRPWLRRQLSSPAQMMSESIALLTRTRAFMLTRPLDFEQLDPTLDTLVAHWQGLRP